jgi:hypothetical protein
MQTATFLNSSQRIGGSQSAQAEPEVTGPSRLTLQVGVVESFSVAFFALTLDA